MINTAADPNIPCHDDLNPQLQLARDFVMSTNRHVFLTGKAGTGKTTFLHRLKESLPKRMIVVAPTGVAAINAGGVTIHSFFQLSFAPKVPQAYLGDGQPIPPSPAAAESRIYRFNREKINIIKSLDLLIIDEISMVRADLLDGIDEVLRRFRKPGLPFGGVQLLMIGDMYQLAPVVKDEDRQVLGAYYDTFYFFGSRALQQTDFVSIDLRKVYRQQDENFIALLNMVRENRLNREALQTLNSRYKPQFSPPSSAGYITLTTHNYQAARINEQKLKELPGKEHHFIAAIDGDFPEYLYPTDPALSLKIGAQVMFCKNDSSREKRYFNGKIGTINAFDKEVISIQCPGEAMPIQVGVEVWDNIKYELDEETKEIREAIIGTFTQYPLKLAWAITIHKSQGLTFERAIIDANAAFAFGQVYVALSRCKTLEGMVLRTPISANCLRSDEVIAGFSQDLEQRPPDLDMLAAAKKVFQQSLIAELFDYTSIRSSLYYLQKLHHEHEEVLDLSPLQGFEGLIAACNRELFHPCVGLMAELSGLFAQNDDLEKDASLQARLASAATQMAGLTMVILKKPLAEVDVMADNQLVEKVVSQALDKLNGLVAVKMACLEAAFSGFTANAHLAARARASLEMEKGTKKKKAVTQPSRNKDGTMDLAAQLKTWRNQLAKTRGIPVYMIINQETIEALVKQRPVSLKELAQVKGLGKKKIDSFGTELLQMIAGDELDA